VKPIIEQASGLKLGAGFSLAMQPEFLREGKAVEDTFRPHCVIIGECDSSAGARLQNFYEGFYSKPRPHFLRMDCASAELVKYANNAFLAMKISMINEIANICERLPGTDVNTVAKAIGLDPRIGSHFLRAGAGFGGSCLPKDLRAITATSRELGFEPILFPAILRANSRQGRRVAELAKSLTKSLRGKRVSVLGLAFKSRTDDMREAPSLEIIERLKRAGATVVAYDPEAMPKARKLMHGVVFASSARQCLKGADLCIVLTEWEEFSTLTAKTLKKEMKKPALLDGRRIYRPEDFAKIPYAAIGLGPRTKSGREYPE
jgi:UDPglucose 6-dehydrogenase